MDFDTKVQPVQKLTANHGKRQNSRLPWIPWIRDFRLALPIAINFSSKNSLTLWFDYKLLQKTV